MNLPFDKFGIALLIGALIGIEREKRQRASNEETAAGLRTFILLAMAGAVAAWLSQQSHEPWLFVGIGLACAGLLIAGYIAHVRQVPGAFGLTTEVAGIVAYLLGGTAVYGYPELAVALAIATSAVLAFREVLHRLVERLGWDDIFATLKLLIVIFIVLPVVPRHPIDPWGALNPYNLTWMVILIAGISFLGYAAARLLGPGRGALTTGLLGGLVSSTAVTLSLARRSHDESNPGVISSLVAGVLLSWAVMFVRVIVAAGVVNPSLIGPLLLPMGAMALITAAGAGIAFRRNPARTVPEHAVPLKNPFSLSFAIKFGLVLGVIILVVNRVSHVMPKAGVYVVSGLAGLADVDAITLSMAERARTAGSAIAVGAITTVVLSNTLVKTGFVYWVGDRRMRPIIAVTAAAITVASIVTFVAMH